MSMSISSMLGSSSSEDRTKKPDVPGLAPPSTKLSYDPIKAIMQPSILNNPSLGYPYSNNSGADNSQGNSLNRISSLLSSTTASYAPPVPSAPLTQHQSSVSLSLPQILTNPASYGNSDALQKEHQLQLPPAEAVNNSRASASASPTPQQTADVKQPKPTVAGLGNNQHSHRHHHHHHHHHYHHHHALSDTNSHEASRFLHSSNTERYQSADASAAPVMLGAVSATSGCPVVNSASVYDTIKHFPRLQLGSLLYEARTEGTLLPRLEGRENCLISVRIPRHLLSRALNPCVAKRSLWGTDIYTDDSDIVSVLYHMGHLPPASSNDDDSTTNEKPTTTTSNAITNNANNDTKVDKRSSSEISSSKRQLEQDGDGLATLLVLPKLEKYQGSLRNGVNSRTWTTQHDGVSFSVFKFEYIARSEIFMIEGLKKRRLEEWQETRDYVLGTRN